MGGSSSSSEQKEINKTNIKTITKIKGGVGLTGKSAVNLTALLTQGAANITATSAAVAQSQLDAASQGSAALAQVNKDIVNAVGKLVSAQDSQAGVIKLAGFGLVAIVAIFYLLRK